MQVIFQSKPFLLSEQLLLMLVHKQHEPSDSKIGQNSFHLPGQGDPIDLINTFGGKISRKGPIGPIAIRPIGGRLYIVPHLFILRMSIIIQILIFSRYPSPAVRQTLN